MTRAFGVFRTWLAALLLASAALVVVPTTAHASGAGTLTALVNSARSAAGLPTLRVDGSLAAVAQRWAEHMAAADQLGHNPSTPSQIPGGWRAWGENVGFSTSPSASSLHRAFMASPEHRANILGRSYTDVGVGYATKGGHTYVSEVFAGYGSTSPSAPKSSSNKSSGKTTTSAHPSTTATHASTTTGTEHATAPPASTPASTDLRLGASGPRVRTVQRELRVHGRAVAVDGVFGPQTDRAVRVFQEAAGLTVDGVVGSRTHAALAAAPTDRERSDSGDHTHGTDDAARRDAGVAAVAPVPMTSGILAPGAAAARHATDAAARGGTRTPYGLSEVARFPRYTGSGSRPPAGFVAALVVLAGLATAGVAALRTRRRGGRRGAARS